MENRLKSIDEKSSKSAEDVIRHLGHLEHQLDSMSIKQMITQMSIAGVLSTLVGVGLLAVLKKWR